MRARASTGPAADGEARRLQPEKIAILGGGMGAMAAAFALTEQPGWDKRFEVHVYQMGWRIGGKGASGRNLDPAQAYRIEEHGFHAWFGFYENAFALIRKCYAELARAPGSPLATWEEAFLQQDSIVYEENLARIWPQHPGRRSKAVKVNRLSTRARSRGAGFYFEQTGDRWQQWQVKYPRKDGTPGDGGIMPGPWECVEMLLTWVWQLLQLPSTDVADEADDHAAWASGWTKLRRRIVRPIVAELRDLGLVALALPLQTAFVILAQVRLLPNADQSADYPRLISVLAGVRQVLWDRLRPVIESRTGARHLWLQIELWLTIAIGMLADRVTYFGFDSIDNEDLTVWLRRHGASNSLFAESTWVRAAYDMAFGFRQGNIDDPQLAAGVGLKGLLRLALTYKGSILWKFSAGTGDTIFAPLYQVLARRGVKFHFFHFVEKLRLSADRRSIEAIDLWRQAIPIPRSDEQPPRAKPVFIDPLIPYDAEQPYDPLIEVDGLPCWPGEPDFTQLRPEDRQKRDEYVKKGASVDLESYWSTWWWGDADRKRTLIRGRDFDQVVLGISLGALPLICGELIDYSAAWHDMVREVQTVATQAFQLWLWPSLAGLGWDGVPSPVLATYVEPLSTWADMSHLIGREGWKARGGVGPGQLSYFLGPLDVKKPEVGDVFDDAYREKMADRVARQQKAVETNAKTYLEQNVGRLWPRASAANGTGFNWNLLVDSTSAIDDARLKSQFVKANVQPSDRYVLSVPGSTQYRLASDNSGFDNLFLAGDWTRTGLNAGCMEAAVMSGLRAARAITGQPIEIVGED